jgi:hypothetical protein
MKRFKLIFLSISLFLTYFLIGQSTSWINQGAKWNYKFWAPGILGNDKIEYTNDTIIMGKTCQVLKTTRFYYGQNFPWNPLVLMSSQLLPNRYTYNHGDTVFYLNNNQFHLLYNFAAQPNERWNLGVDTNYFNCSKSITIVDSIATELIGATTHRILYTKDSLNSSVSVEGKIIEHIGSLNYLFPLDRNCDPQIIVDFYIFTFSCFEDSSTSYLLVNPDECNNPYHVGIFTPTFESKQFFCYPNPANNYFTIEKSIFEFAQLEIKDILGKTLLADEMRTTKHTIDVSTFAPGIYFIKVTTANQQQTIKVIKQ